LKNSKAFDKNFFLLHFLVVLLLYFKEQRTIYFINLIKMIFI
jgi:hypothetical protein